MKFIGRENEKKKLINTLNKNYSETILIYGRRRVGKSELIKQCLKEIDDTSIYYECKQTTEINNVESLASLISEQFHYPKLAFSNLEALLSFLFEKAIENKMILVLDEYPYLRKTIVGIDSILQSLIDKYKDVSTLKLILCGSYVDIMKSLIEIHNPLYGRVTQIVDLKPMDYYESSKFYPNFSNEDKVKLYSVFGGIPHYNKLIDSHKSVKENIIDLIASPNARLELEISMYLKSEISKMINANEVFEAMAMGANKYSDILSKSHVSSAPTLIDVLDKLIKMEVVTKETPINEEHNRKKSRYFICDNLSLFYYKYIFRYASQMNIMDSEVFYKRYIDQDFNTQHVPFIFENICKQFLIRLNRKGLIEEPFEKIGKYYYDDPINKKNGEFDLITYDRKGYTFYEAKFKNSKVDKNTIYKEIEQVKETGFNCYRYGFFSKSGFEEINDDTLILYTLDDLFKDM